MSTPAMRPAAWAARLVATALAGGVLLGGHGVSGRAQAWPIQTPSIGEEAAPNLDSTPSTTWTPTPPTTLRVPAVTASSPGASVPPARRPPATPAARAKETSAASPRRERRSPDLIAHLAWVARTGDARGAPFAVLDKRRARLWLFDAGGREIGQTPVLLGAAVGDATVPGIGDRPLEDVLPHERTTPAGRFVAEWGVNASQESVVWIDYDAAVSMHRVRNHVPAERRLQRLASPVVAERRVSWGCINLPVAFFEGPFTRWMQHRRAVVYILPEAVAPQSLFTPVDSRRAPVRTGTYTAAPRERS